MSSQSVSPFWIHKDGSDWKLMMNDDVVGSSDGEVVTVSERVPEEHRPRVERLLESFEAEREAEADVTAAAAEGLDYEIRKLVSLMSPGHSGDVEMPGFDEVSRALNALGAVSSGCRIQKYDRLTRVVISDPEQLLTEHLFSIADGPHGIEFVSGRIEEAAARNLMTTLLPSLLSWSERTLMFARRFEPAPLSVLPVSDFMSIAFGDESSGYSADTDRGNVEALPADTRGQVRVRLNGVVLADVQMDLNDGVPSLKVRGAIEGVNEEIVVNVMSRLFESPKAETPIMPNDEFQDILVAYLDAVDEMASDTGWVQELSMEESRYISEREESS